jgi:hypothetical protein
VRQAAVKQIYEPFSFVFVENSGGDYGDGYADTAYLQSVKLLRLRHMAHV